MEAAAAPEAEQGQVALEAVLVRYRPALLAHLRVKFYCDPHEAEDLFQGFVEKKILERNILSAADRNRGRFRNFLLMALDNFVRSEHRRRHARKRRAYSAALSIDELPEELLPCTQDEPSDEVESLWGKAVIAGALLNMERELQLRGRSETYEIFLHRFLRPVLGEAEPLAYADLVERYQLESPSQASNVLNTAKRIFRRHLQEVVREYLRDHQEIEDELGSIRRRMFSAK